MKIFMIKSPSGKTEAIYAESFYHAIELCMRKDYYAYDRSKYFDINPILCNQ